MISIFFLQYAPHALQNCREQQYFLLMSNLITTMNVLFFAVTRLFHCKACTWILEQPEKLYKLCSHMCMCNGHNLGTLVRSGHVYPFFAPFCREVNSIKFAFPVYLQRGMEETRIIKSSVAPDILPRSVVKKMESMDCGMQECLSV